MVPSHSSPVSPAIAFSPLVPYSLIISASGYAPRTEVRKSRQNGSLLLEAASSRHPAAPAFSQRCAIESGLRKIKSRTASTSRNFGKLSYSPKVSYHLGHLMKWYQEK